MIDNYCDVGNLAKNRHSLLASIKRLVMWRGYVYRATMRIAHKFNWHYAPPIHLGDNTQLWCQWCGFRQTIKEKTPEELDKEACERLKSLIEDTV